MRPGAKNADPAGQARGNVGIVRRVGRVKLRQMQRGSIVHVKRSPNPLAKPLTAEQITRGEKDKPQTRKNPVKSAVLSDTCAAPVVAGSGPAWAQLYRQP